MQDPILLFSCVTVIPLLQNDFCLGQKPIFILVLTFLYSLGKAQQRAVRLLQIK